MFQPFNESYVRASVEATLDHVAHANEEQAALSMRNTRNPAHTTLLTRLIRWLIGARAQVSSMPTTPSIKSATPSRS